MNTKLWQKHWADIINHISIVENTDQQTQLLEALQNIKVTSVLAFVNAHAMNLLASKPNVFAAFASATILVRDGIGMALLYKRLGKNSGLNMNGTDFIPKILPYYRDRKIVFLGTDQQTVTRASDYCLQTWNVEIFHCHHGFEDSEYYLELAKNLQPDLLVLGMGMPKQELVAQMIRENVENTVLVICGGAIFDFLAGKVNRAPAWMQDMGLEWFYRLLQEPKRLWKRYVAGNLIFLLRLCLYEK